MGETDNTVSQPPATLHSSTGSDGEEQLVDYTEHNAAEVGVLNRLWYKEAVFYEMYVRAFCDLEGTGNGGITGITSRLDYLHYLGVDCIWLLPIYPSPLKDDGYDVADYCDVHSDYGSLEDFRTLVAAVHERNMKIIVDFIPNHCSEKHRWFQEARKDRNSPYRDYFVWTDDPQKYKEARIIFLDVEPSNWTYDEVAGQYFWHRFFAEQPDLKYPCSYSNLLSIIFDSRSFDNPKVQEEMLNTMKFWLDVGIDGFRVDAVPYLFEREGTSCENLPETHDFLRKMRKFVDDNYPGRVMLAEACQMPHEVRKYFGETGDEFHMGFHFPVMPRIYMSIKREDGTCLKEIMENTPDIPPNCQWVTFLRNHDELTLEMVTPDERKWMWEKYAPDPRMKLNLGIRRRLAPLLDNDQRKIELAYSLLFTLPGSPIIYYGDEIGMGDNWTSEAPHGGFSPATKIYSPVIKDEQFGFHRINVDLVTKDPSSIYHVIRTMMQRRRTHLAFGHGDFHWAPSNTPTVASFLRTYGIDRLLCVHNLSSKPQDVTIYLPASEFRSASYDIKTSKGKDLPNHQIFDILTDLPSTVTVNGTVHLTMEPYQYLWLNLGEMRQLGDTTQKPVSNRRGSITPPPMELVRTMSGRNVLRMDAITEDD